MSKAHVYKRDHINTDEIIPARYLNTDNEAELAKCCLEDLDAEFVDTVEPGDVIVAGEDFGCGSSREHAVWAIRGAKVGTIIAKSFARIFYRNAINCGFYLIESPEAMEQINDGDILEIDLRQFTASADRKITVIGNLPYNISSQVLIKLIHSRNDFNRAIFMFQKELAQRIAAQPGGKAYGRITAMLRYCAEIKTLLNVKASAFYPQPKVDSAVIEVKFKPTTDYGPHDEAMLFAVIKAAFGNRRKTLKNALTASGLSIDSQTALQALSSAGIDHSRRAETLEPGEFVSLEVCLREAMVKSEG